MEASRFSPLDGKIKPNTPRKAFLEDFIYSQGNVCGTFLAFSPKSHRWRSFNRFVYIIPKNHPSTCVHVYECVQVLFHLYLRSTLRISPSASTSRGKKVHIKEPSGARVCVNLWYGLAWWNPSHSAPRCNVPFPCGSKRAIDVLDDRARSFHACFRSCEPKSTT